MWMANNRSRSRQVESSEEERHLDVSHPLNLPSLPLYSPPFVPRLTKFLTTAHVRPPKHTQTNAVPSAPASHTLHTRHTHSPHLGSHQPSIPPAAGTRVAIIP
jgi:hypothetical protein